MSILQLAPIKIGQTGVQPSTYKMVSTDALSTIITAGYLKQGTSGQFFQKNDLVEGLAAYGTPNVENVVLYITIDSNGVITLNEDLPEGLGQAALKNVTDNTKPLVVSVNGATTAGHVATFSDTTGTVQDGGALGQAAFKNVSDNSMAIVASVKESPVAGNLLAAFDTFGTIEDSGIDPLNVQQRSSIFAQIETSNIGGAGPGPYTVAAPGLTSSSVVVASLQVQAVPTTPAAAVSTCIAGLNTFNVSFTVDPGNASVLNWIAFRNPQ